MTVLSRLKKFSQFQKIKYQNLGFGKYVSILTFILLFIVYPKILQYLWLYIQNYFNPITFYVITVTLLNLVIVGIYSFCMYFIYTKKMPFFQKYRSDNTRKWPWQQNKHQWKNKFNKTIIVTLFNFLIVGPLITIIDSVLDFRFKMTIEDGIPSLWTNIWQFFFFIFFNETLFYFVHKLLHHPKFYWIHKQHHQYNTTIDIALVYASPLQHIFANVIPTGIGFKILAKYTNVHIFTILIWLTFRLIQSCDGHSGYDWSWAQSRLLPFCGGGNYHYYHHSKNTGNYGAILSIYDIIFNTNTDYAQKLEKQMKINSKLKQQKQQ